jgi:glycosyltransferase involved in cell wall biosynthesis
MLGNGSRGDLIEKNPSLMAEKIIHYLSNEREYQKKALEAMNWSREFTLEKFDSEIKKIVNR